MYYFSNWKPFCCKISNVNKKTLIMLNIFAGTGKIKSALFKTNLRIHVSFVLHEQEKKIFFKYFALFCRGFRWKWTFYHLWFCMETRHYFQIGEGVCIKWDTLVSTQNQNTNVEYRAICQSTSEKYTTVLLISDYSDLNGQGFPCISCILADRTPILWS